MWRASSVSNESTDLAQSRILNCLRISLLDTTHFSKSSWTSVPLQQCSSRRVVRCRLVWPTYTALHLRQVIEYTTFRMNNGTGHLKWNTWSRRFSIFKTNWTGNVLLVFMMDFTKFSFRTMISEWNMNFPNHRRHIDDRNPLIDVTHDSWSNPKGLGLSDERIKKAGG